MTGLRVLGWGTYDARRHPRVGIVLDGLRSVGCDVTEVNESDTSSTADRVAMLKKPWRALPWAASLVSRWRRLAKRGKAADAPDAVVVGYMGHFDVLVARRAFRHTPIVLDHLIFAEDTAKDRGATGKVLLPALRALDRAALRSADVILLDTQEHLEMLPARLKQRGVVVPVGATDDWHAADAAGTTPGNGGTLRVIFFGLFTPLQGATTIGEAARLLAEQGADVEFTLVGSGQDEAATRAALGDAAVTWHPWVDADDLPGLVAEHDVCLGIFGTTPKALRVVPNKVYQGLAAGRAVVTSDTVPQRRALGDAVEYVAPGDAQALAHILSSLASEPERVAQLAARARSARETFTAAAVGRIVAEALTAEELREP